MGILSLLLAASMLPTLLVAQSTPAVTPTDADTSGVAANLAERYAAGWRRPLVLRFRFVDREGHPVDGVQVLVEKFVAGGWEGREEKSDAVATAVWEYDAGKTTTANFSFRKADYYGNSLRFDALALPPDAKGENGKIVVERRIEMIRTSAPLPETLFGNQVRLITYREGGETTGTLINVFGLGRPHALRALSWPTTEEGLQGLGFVFQPAPGVEVKQKEYHNHHRRWTVDLSPRDLAATMVFLDSKEEDHDGFIRYVPMSPPACEDFFPVEMATAPETGYEAQVRFTPDDFATDHDAPLAGRLYFYFRYKGCYGTMVLNPWSTDYGKVSVEWKASIAFNPKPGDRDVRTEPCW